MSDDTFEDVDLARADWSYPIPVDLDDNQRRFDNPLVKGLIVLLMVAVATTVLVATDDDPDASIVASGAIGSNLAGPVTSESPATSVQAVASETASSSEAESAESDQAEDTADAWAVDGPTIQESAAAEIRRQEALRDRPTTTTTAPTTTEAPTTAAPSTTTAAAATDTDTDTDTDAGSSTTTVVAADEQAGGTESTEASQSSTTSTEPATTVPETTVAETTVPEETTTTVAAGDGWVDTGNGVLVPPVLLAIRWCESRDDYQAANPSSSARGAYQFLSGSWAAYGHADRYGVSTADQATRVQQDEAALLTWERDGTRPWNASRSCWSQRI